MLARRIWSRSPKSLENDALFDRAYTAFVSDLAFCQASISVKPLKVAMTLQKTVAEGI